MNENVMKNTKTSKELIDEATDEIENSDAQSEHMFGIPSGFPTLDKLTCEFKKSELTVIGGRPSMGKTSLMLHTLRNMAIDNDCPVALFSLEDSSESITMRLIATESELEINK